MKTVNISVTCRRDYMSVFPVNEKQYKALSNKINKDGYVNVDDVCEKLGRTEPLNRDMSIEHGLIVAEVDPFISVEVEGNTVFSDNVEMKAATSNPYDYEFVNVDPKVSDAFISEMKENEFEADPEDDYSISNYLTNNLEQVKIENAGFDEIEDGQQVFVAYYGGYEENSTLYYSFEMDDNEEFDIEKLNFFRACIEDQCEGIGCSGIAGGFDIYLEDMILYGNKVIGMTEIDVDDYGDDETALGEYYPGDCINFE